MAEEGCSMGKRLAVLGAAIALVALVLGMGVVSPALGSSGDDDKERTIRVRFTTTEEAFVDVGDEGESLGDQFVFSGTLEKGGDEVGSSGVVCTTVSVERGEAQCVATAWFHDGQITAQVLVNVAEEPSAIPITGGSGKYEGAEGEIVPRPISETEEILIFHLED
jgi:hypothetical protein